MANELFFVELILIVIKSPQKITWFFKLHNNKHHVLLLLLQICSDLQVEEEDK